MVGALRFETWLERDMPALAQHVGQQVTLEGVIESEPDPGITTASFRVEIERVETAIGWVETDGAVLIRLGEYARHLPGERVRLAGELAEPSALPEFDYRGYLLRQGIVGTMLFPEVETLSPAPRLYWRRLLAEARLSLEASLQRALPEPAASLGAGITFGRDDTLPDELYDDFRATGLAHIVAVSGSNVAMVTAVVFFICVRFMRRQHAAIPAALALIAYVGISGLEWSVIRAGLMALIFLGGLWLGRGQSALAALGGAAILMTFVQPSAAVELGFQLSLAATAGLIVFGPWIRYGMERLLERVGLASFVPELVLQVAALSASATVATLPLMWVNFGQVSLISIFANGFVEPLFFVTFWLTTLTAVGGLLWEPLGWTFGLVAYYPLAFITWIAEAGADVPFAAVAVPEATGTQALFVYLAIGAAGWPAYRYLVPAEPPAEPTAQVRSVHRSVLAGAGGALLIAALPLSLLPARGPGELRIDFLNVGQGDAVLLTTPHGRQVLVDGGPSGILLARELGDVLPHWDRRIDQVLLTHPQQDHLAGLVGLARRFDVNEFATNGREGSSATARLLWESLEPAEVLEAGDTWELDGVQFAVLWPPPGHASRQANDLSLVLRVTYEGVVVLLTGDIEAAAQRALIAEADVRAHVLKVPHHGSKTSEPAFFAAVEPRLAVISAGADNRFGHPHAETLAALADRPLSRTDMHGRVTLHVGDGRVRISTER